MKTARASLTCLVESDLDFETMINKTDTKAIAIIKSQAKMLIDGDCFKLWA